MTMQTRERAEALAKAASEFPMLGPLCVEELLELVQLELGDADRLDRFCRNGATAMSRALPRSPVVHIISGNTPHAGLQSLLRGLLVGAENRVKLPTGGLPEVNRFCALLPEELAAKVELVEELPPHWLPEAETVVVFGSDETVASVRSRLRGDQTLVAHGHRLSFGVIFGEAHGDLREVAKAAARDASLYDQQGCLSPHLFYLPAPLVTKLGPLLAEEMAAFEQHTPRSPLTPAEERDIMAARSEATFRAAVDPRARLWSSGESSAWTVIAEPGERFVPSTLNRVIRLIPLPDSRKAFLTALAASAAPVRKFLSTIGVEPATPENAEALLPLGASRITPLGQMQLPGPLWHHDGQPVLLPLVRWVDYERKMK